MRHWRIAFNRTQAVFMNPNLNNTEVFIHFEKGYPGYNLLKRKVCSSNMYVFVQVPECQLEALKLSLDSNLMEGSIVICSHMRPLCFYKISRSRSGGSDSLLEVPLKEVQDAVVLCVSAIGCPESLALGLMQVFLHHVCLIIEYSFILMGLMLGVGPLWFYFGCFV